LTSQSIYLPASRANGAIIWIDSGSASLYAGAPNAPSHRLISSISAGGHTVVSGLGDDEVLSVQSSGTFSFQIDLLPEPAPEVPGGNNSSLMVTWTCTGSECPWGTTLTGQALPWPASSMPTDARLGYTASHAVYLSAAAANGTTVSITRGVATLYAGLPADASHRVLATVPVGGSYTVSGLAPAEVLSVQSDYTDFDFEIAFGDPAPDPQPGDPPLTFQDSSWLDWYCTVGCNWGPTVGAHSVIWDSGTVNGEQGFEYRTNEAAYLAAAHANGATVYIEQGSATLYLGVPGSQWSSTLVTVSAGESYQVNGLASGQFLSISNDNNAFRYTVQFANPPGGDPGPTDPPATGGTASEWVDWNCSGNSCSWGPTVGAHSIVWDAETVPGITGFQYSTAADVYLVPHLANGSTISITEGMAHLYVGTYGEPWAMTLVTLYAGQSHNVFGLLPNQFLSVSNDYDPFTYTVELGQGSAEPPGDPGDLQYSVSANWRCDSQQCQGGDWLGTVISWPSWSAYPNNSRSGNNSRTVFGDSGELLYPYMGSWADGCRVNAHQGAVLIIEWQRGTDIWRETTIYPGQSYVIDLVGAENGALIESNGAGTHFGVTLENCEPQPLP
jgi:hypothetical protein